MQMDNSLRIIFANEPFLKLIGTDSKSLVGKNIEYTPVALVFDEVFTGFIENIRKGIAGKEWCGEIELSKKISSYFAGSHQRFLMMGEKEYPLFLRILPKENRRNGKWRRANGNSGCSRKTR